MSDYHALSHVAGLSEADAQALADVRTLDEWAYKHRNKKAEVVTRYIFGDDCMVWQVSLRLQGQGALNFEVQDRDDARHAAAEWIRSQK